MNCFVAQATRTRQGYKTTDEKLALIVVTRMVLYNSGKR